MIYYSPITPTEFLPKPKDLKTPKYVNEQPDPRNPHTAYKCINF